MRLAPLTSLLLGALLLALASAAAHAEPVGAPLTVRLTVLASPDCTTPEELQARVTDRSARIRFDDRSPIEIHATVTRAPGAREVTGLLTIARPGAPPAARRIAAPSCQQANDGLALVIVLALDPDALAPPTPPPPAPPPRAPPPATPRVAETRPAPPDVRTRWGIELGALAIAGPAPRSMPGLWVGGRVTRDRARGASAALTWSPALVVSLVHARATGLSEPGGTAGFTLDAGRLDACPVSLAGWLLEARACASLLAGRLEATGADTYGPASTRRPFVAGGVSLLAAVDLGAHLMLGARLEAAASWVRDAYAFSPTEFHRAAAVTLGAGLWLGLRFR